MVTWEEHSTGFFACLDVLVVLHLDRPCAQTNDQWRIRLDRSKCGEHTYCGDDCEVCRVAYRTGKLGASEAKESAIAFARSWLSGEIELLQKQLAQLG